MFIPKIDQIFPFNLHNNAPTTAKINHHVENNVFNVTIFKQNGEVHHTHDIDFDNDDYHFFNASNDSKYYYQIICLEDNSYDAICSHELDVFFDINEAMKLCDVYEKTNPDRFNCPEFMVVVNNFCLN